MIRTIISEVAESFKLISLTIRCPVLMKLEESQETGKDEIKS
jgi:hypothetical protein